MHRQTARGQQRTRGRIGLAIAIISVIPTVASLPATASPDGGTPHREASAADLLASSANGVARAEDWAENAHWWTAADGVRHAELFTGPVFFQDHVGAWRPIDLELEPVGDLLAAREGPDRLPRLASLSGPALTVDSGAGTTSITYPDAVASAGVVSGREVRYASAFGAGRDLALILTTTGYEELVRLPDASSAAYRVDLDLPTGVTVQERGLGVELVGPGGQLIAQYGQGFAADSRSGTEGVGVEVPVWTHVVSQAAGHATVEVTVDHDWLMDTNRVFPVIIDPSYSDTTASAGSFDGYVNSDNPEVNYPRDSTAGPVYSKQIHLRSGSPGFCESPEVTPPCTTNRTRSFLQFPMNTFVPANAVVQTASMSLFNYYSTSTSALSSDIYGLAAPASDSSTWNTQPGLDGYGIADRVQFGSGSTGAGPCQQPQPPSSPSCGGSWVAWSGLVPLAQRWLQNGNNGLAIYAADEHDVSYHRRYYSSEYGYGYAPRLDITYVMGGGAATVTSGSHPNQSSWYANKTVGMHIAAPGLSGTMISWSHLLTTSATAEPDDTPDFQFYGEFDSTYTNWPEGTQYYAVKYFNGSTWSPTARYRVNVDAVAPEACPCFAFPRSHEVETWDTEHDGTIEWTWVEAQDLTSGVAGYSVAFNSSAATGSADNVPEVPAGSGSVTSPLLSTGNWYLHLRAVDRAGNATPEIVSGPVHLDLSDPAPVVNSVTDPDQARWYPDRTGLFSWSVATRPVESIAGYSVALDQDPAGQPDGIPETRVANWPEANIGDGTWYFHVRAISPGGHLGAVGSYRVNIDGSAPNAPVIASSSHPSANETYPTSRFDASWTSTDLSGVAGYSYVVDQLPTTDPDTITDTTTASASTTGLANGSWFFHVRSQNGAGLWGSSGHYPFTVDVPCASTPDHCGLDSFDLAFKPTPTQEFSATDSLLTVVVGSTGGQPTRLVERSDPATALTFTPLGTAAQLGATSQLAPDLVAAVSLDGTWRRLYRPAAGGYATNDVLSGPAAPTAFDELVSGPPGMTLVLQDDRTVAILDGQGQQLGWVSLPTVWDAAGGDVPVAVTLLPGNIIHTVVSTTLGTPFPVTIDPYRLRGGKLSNRSSQDPTWWFKWQMKQQTQTFYYHVDGSGRDPQRDFLANVRTDLAVDAPNLHPGPGTEVRPRVYVTATLGQESVAQDMSLYVIIRCKHNKNDQKDPTCPESSTKAFEYDSRLQANGWRRQFKLEVDVPIGPMPSSGERNFYYEVLVRPSFRLGSPDDSNQSKFRTLDLTCDPTRCVFDSDHRSGGG